MALGLAMALGNDDAFQNVTGMEVLQAAAAGESSFVLDSDAQAAGIRTVIGGSGKGTLDASAYTVDVTLDASANSNTTANQGATLLGGSGNNTFRLLNNNVLGVSSVVGGSASDTLSFTQDGLSITDGNFTRVQNVEVLRTGNGTNYVNLAGHAATAGIKTLVGGTGADTVDATSFSGATLAIDSGNGSDFITGSSTAENSILSGAGNDSITLADAAAVGRSTVVGGADTDTLSLAGSDTLSDAQLANVSGVEVLRAAATGNSSLTVGTNAQAVGLRTVLGGGGDDTLNAVVFTAGVTLNGGAGNDSLLVSSGAILGQSSVVGGIGTDTIALSIDALSITDSDFTRVSTVEVLRTANGDNWVQLGANAQTAGLVTVVGGANKDTLDATAMTRALTLDGGQGDNSLVGGSANDRLVAYDGADVLDGGAGIDTMVGGKGNDTYYLSDDDEWIVENEVTGAGANYIIVQDNVSNWNTLTGGDASFVVNALVAQVGDAGDNTLVGTPLKDTISGAAGNDTIIGANGTDSLMGDEGNDSISGGGGADTILGGDDNDTLLGDAGADSIEGGIGTDSILGGADNDTILGGADNDTLLGDAGADSIEGGNGTDSILGGADNDTLLGQAGSDTIFGEAGNDSMLGGADADSLIAGTGTDTLLGEAGNDTLVADASGNASLLGGDDSDSFLFTSGAQVLANTVVGGDGTDTLVLTATSTVTDAQLANVSGVEAIQVSSLAGNSITLGVNAQAGGLLSLFGGASSDLLSAAGMVSGNIWIQGDAVGGTSTLGDTLVAGAGTSRATLVGRDHADADNYFRISTASLLGNNSIVGGANSEDYLEITGNNQTLSDSSFAQVSNLDGIILSGQLGRNTLSLGVTAQTKFGTEISLTGGSNGGDTIDLSGTTKKVWLDASAGNNGDTITAGTFENTLIGGAGASANDLFIFNKGSHFTNASIVGGGGTDTLRLSANGQTVSSAALTGLSGIEVFDLAGAGNSITLGAISAGIATIVGGTGPNTFDASGYNSAPNALTWNMNASNGSDVLLGGANGNLFQIKNGANLQNSFITGNTGNDTIQLLAGAQTLGDSTFSNISGSSIEQLVLGSATANGNSITLGTIAASKGIDTVIGGTRRDTIDATAFNSAITIDASASSGSRLIGSTVNGNLNTLIGGATGGNEFVLGSISSNSLVGGSNGLDTLTLTQGGALIDTAFIPVSKIGTLKFEDNGNTVTLGANALIAGIRTLVGGEGGDDGTGNTFNTSAYGSAGVLFQITDQDYLSNVAAIIGGTGVDTLKFSRDGVSVTDENVANLTNIDILRTANGNNRFLFDDDYLTAGIETIIGGTGRDTIDMASNLLYTPGSDADIITVDASAGAGYTLVSTTQNFGDAKVIGSSTNKGAVILDGANLVDADFLNMYQGNIGTLTMRTQTNLLVTLAEMAVASGLDQLQLGGGADLVDVTDFVDALTVRGAAGNDIVTTSFAALSSLSFIGGDGIDILRLADAEARSITSLSGDFEAFALETGNNFVLLENEASRGGITRIIGGLGFDTLSAINLTTGIDFQVFGNRMGNANTDASIQGGSGVDTLSVDFFDPITIVNTFNDTQFERVGSFGRLDGFGAIEAFNTQADGQDYAFGSNAHRAGIRTIYGHDGDLLDASTYDDIDPATPDVPSLNFVFATRDDLFGVVWRNTDVTGTAGDSDTITLTTAGQLIALGDFANHSGVERLVLADAASDTVLGSTVVLDADTDNAGIREIVFGVGRDILGFISTVNTSFTLQGGSGDDLAFLGDTAATLLDAAFTSWTSIEEFHTDDGNNDITFGLQAQEAGIVTMVGGANNDTFDASAYTTVSITLVGNDGDDSLLSGAGNDAIDGGNGADWIQATSAISAGVNQIDTLTGGAGADTFVLGDASNPYYNTAASAGDYALITDFNAAVDLLQLRDLTGGVNPNGGYLFGAAIYGAIGGANSYLYVDTDGSTTVNTGDNLVAAINSTVALTTADLTPPKVSII